MSARYDREYVVALPEGGLALKSRVGAIFTKLDVRDRAAAIVFAYDHGLVDPGSPPPP
jgi:hypothetical protein